MERQQVGSNTLPRLSGMWGPAPPPCTYPLPRCGGGALLGFQGPRLAELWAGRGGHGNGKEREGGEGKGGRWPQRLGCILAAGHRALLPTCSLSPQGRTRSRSRHASPYPATPETPTSLSWKWDWARFLIDSCWAEGWQGREVERMGRKTPHTHSKLWHCQ